MNYCFCVTVIWPNFHQNPTHITQMTLSFYPPPPSRTRKKNGLWYLTTRKKNGNGFLFLGYLCMTFAFSYIFLSVFEHWKLSYPDSSKRAMPISLAIIWLVFHCDLCLLFFSCCFFASKTGFPNFKYLVSIRFPQTILDFSCLYRQFFFCFLRKNHSVFIQFKNTERWIEKLYLCYMVGALLGSQITTETTTTTTKL